MKFADPKNDMAFRKIFGDENRKHLLLSFLNHILGFAGTGKEITGVKLTNPYQVPQLTGLKETILDLKALDKRGVNYIIEMQVLKGKAFEKRVLYYISKAYAQQLDKGEDYPRLNQVIFLGFLDFDLFKEAPSYSTRHLILEEKTNGHYFKDFELNFVSLPKFNIPLEQLTGLKEKWIYFLKHAAGLKEIPPQLQGPPELKAAFEAANQVTWTREELDAYDYRGMMNQAQRGQIALAREEGVEEGKQIGFEDGVEKNKLTIARTMLKEGFDPEDISRITGLSPEHITFTRHETGNA